MSTLELAEANRTLTASAHESIAAHEKQAAASKKLKEEHQKLLDSVHHLEFGFQENTNGLHELGQMGERVTLKLRSLHEEVELLQRAGQFQAAMWKQYGIQIGG